MNLRLAGLSPAKWLEAEGALAEVQDRVGRLLLEVALKQTSVPIPIAEPPSDAGSGELDAVICEHGVDLVGDGCDQPQQEVS